MINYKERKRVVRQVHIDTVRVGDVIIHEGKERTVNRNNIKYNSFMGVSIFGDTYQLGRKPVHKLFWETVR